MNMAMTNKFAQVYANNYIETSVTEASPHKLVSMLYEGAVKNLHLMKFFIEKKDYEKKSEHSNKLLGILSALRNGVDLKVGGDVSSNLYGLYDYCYRKTLEASRTNDLELLKEIQEIIETLQSAWAQMPESVKRASKHELAREAGQ